MASSTAQPSLHPSRDSWHDTTTETVKATVSLKWMSPYSLDGSFAKVSQATGFIVDKKRGIIVTNRHVIGLGPFVGTCVFHNDEQCDVNVYWVDPCHDYGFLTFDPEKVQIQDFEELTFDPCGAEIGTEVRIIGNNAGAKTSIFEGIISRLDRNPLDLKRPFTQYNMSFIQAAVTTSGGTSGSAVVNINRKVVGIHCGGNTAINFACFLPVNMADRALKKLLANETITRGTISVVWHSEPIAKCRRLQLSPSWQTKIRKAIPAATTLLVAETVVPEGPAHGKIQTGDILLQVNGQFLTKFISLDEILDTSVGDSIQLLVQRNGKDVIVDVTVNNLLEMIPSRFVTLAGATFHDVSYQQSFAHAVPARGLFVSDAKGSFARVGERSGWVITSINSNPISNLDDFIKIMKDMPDRSTVVIDIGPIANLRHQQQKIIDLDRHWSSMKIFTQNNQTSEWDISPEADPVYPPALSPQKADFPCMKGVSEATADACRSIVKVSCSIPFQINGMYHRQITGKGVVLTEDGLVWVSRNTVPHECCDVSITVANSVTVMAKVIFMHHSYGFGLIKYDTSSVQASFRRTKLVKKNLRTGQSVRFIGFQQEEDLPSITDTTVTQVKTFYIHPESGKDPQYTPANFDAVKIANDMGCQDGVIINNDGGIQALWMNHYHDKQVHRFGLPSALVIPVRDEIQNGQQPDPFILDVKFDEISMNTARALGVSAKRIDELANPKKSMHRLYQVQAVAIPPRSVAARGNVLQPGDILLTIENQLITKPSQLKFTTDAIHAIIVRGRQEIALDIPTVPTKNWETHHFITFAGAILHRPHHAVRQQALKVPSEVYVNDLGFGTPSHMYELWADRFITAVNGNIVHDIAQFMQQVEKFPTDVFLNISTVNLTGQHRSVTLKTNHKYFPMEEYIKDGEGPSGWKRICRTAKAI